MLCALSSAPTLGRQLRNGFQMRLTVLQLTDCHLLDGADGQVFGLDTEETFNWVTDLLQQRFPNPDLIIGTGDIAEDGSAAAYKKFVDKVAKLSRKVVWLPGNHDVLSAMQEVDASLDVKVIEVGNWRILLLDSHIEGQVEGYLAPAELDFLAAELAKDTERPVLVGVHHPPIDIEATYLNPHRIGNANDFFAVLDRFTNIKGVFFGHIHQLIDQLRGNVRLLASPSTCHQFFPRGDSFALDDLPPGFRWFELFNGGRFATGVVRIDAELMTGKQIKANYGNN